MSSAQFISAQINSVQFNSTSNDTHAQRPSKQATLEARVDALDDVNERRPPPQVIDVQLHELRRAVGVSPRMRVAQFVGAPRVDVGPAAVGAHSAFALPRTIASLAVAKPPVDQAIPELLSAALPLLSIGGVPATHIPRKHLLPFSASIVASGIPTGIRPGASPAPSPPFPASLPPRSRKA